MTRKRIRALAATLLAILIAGATAFSTPLVPARGTPRQLTVTSFRDGPYPPSNGGSHFIRADQGTGGIAICAQSSLFTPNPGQKLDYYGSPKIKELDYVLWHGYDGEVVTSLYGMDEERSETATIHAAWLAIGDKRLDLLGFKQLDGTIRHGNCEHTSLWEHQTDKQVKDAAWRLYSEAVEYAKHGGGVEEGCATLWLNKNSKQVSGKTSYCYQCLVTVQKDIEATFTKKSRSPEISTNNPSYSMEGAVYDILDATGAKVTTITFDKNGCATTRLPANRSYKAVEIKAPRGYIRDDAAVPFKIATTEKSIQLSDSPGTARITIAKKDAASKGEAQPGLSLAGARYKLVSLSTPGWTKIGTTKADGTLTFAGVPLGDVRITEVSAPEGYKTDSTVHEFHIDPKDLNGQSEVKLLAQDEFYETPVAFDIDITKFTSGTSEGSKLEKPAEGVAFEIKSNTTGKVVGTVTTDKNGRVSTKDKWFGTSVRPREASGAIPYDRGGYTIHEVESTVPEGYSRIEDWVISTDEMTDGANLSYIVNNSAISTHLQIVKTDADTGSTIPLQGFTFQVLDKDERPIKMQSWHPGYQVLDRFTTDESGSVTLPESLPAGTYTIREVSAAKPYTLNTKDMQVTINAANGHVEPITTVSFENKCARGKATIIKTCGQTGKPLEGAEYDVVASDDILSPANTIDAVRGEIVDHVTTDKHGRATTKELPLGSGEARYAFIETKAPDKHVIDPSPHEFTLSYKDEKTSVVTTSVKATDEATRIEVKKLIKGTGSPLEGAAFALWNPKEQIDLAPKHGLHAVAIETNGHASGISLEPIFERCEIETDCPEDIQVTIAGADEPSSIIKPGTPTSLHAGKFSLSCTDLAAGGEPSKTAEIELQAGWRYFLHVDRGIFGISCRITDKTALASPIALSKTERASVLASPCVPTGSYKVLVGTKCMGTIHVSRETTSFFKISNGKLEAVPTILKEGEPIKLTTDKFGNAAIDHLPSGEYRITEIAAPSGYLVDPTTKTIHIDDNGLVDDSSRGTVVVEDVFTRISISKRDSESEEPVIGAQLALLDSDGNTIDSWTSSTNAHAINALAPGHYSLVEKTTPRDYDVASAVEFDVKATDTIQEIVMYDRPISIHGQVDKVQEIATPIAKGAFPNGDGKNKADASASQEGIFHYSIDARNTSDTWVDEFTIEDNLLGARGGFATLKAISTPAATGDFDGKLNIWYLTESISTADTNAYPNESANATKDDGHTNPWLPDGERKLDYSGWKLWAKGLPTNTPQHLDASALNLSKDERICSIRLEYGRVDSDFTSRIGKWDRRSIKDVHDDSSAMSGIHDSEHAPAIIEMKVTEAYRDGALLQNDASVHLYRNGGGGDLEAHDTDSVEQTCKTVKETTETPHRPLDQTGIATNLNTFLLAMALLFAGVAIWSKR